MVITRLPQDSASRNARGGIKFRTYAIKREVAPVRKEYRATPRGLPPLRGGIKSVFRYIIPQKLAIAKAALSMATLP
jgi:hypothetical protein